MKIRTTDLERGREIVAWLKKNVGPQLKGNHGTSVHGEGWAYWVNFDNANKPMVTFEVSEEHVDKDTLLLFALTWA